MFADIWTVQSNIVKVHILMHAVYQMFNLLFIFYVTLDHKTILSRWGIFVTIAKIHCMGQNYRFFFYAKNH